MENSGERSGEEARMYSDSDLLPILEEEKDYVGMENNGEQSGEEAPMYSDSYLLPKLEELHNYESEPEAPIPLLTIVEEFIVRATGNIQQGSKDALLEDRKGTHAFQILVDEYAKLPPEIGSLSSQMTSGIMHGNDTHTITLNVLNHLSKFDWDDKAGLTLAAFALTFGDFWLLVRIYADNVVNELMTTDSRELTSTNKEAYRNQIKANNEFIKMLVNALRYLFDITIDKIHRDRGPIYVYWIVRCAIAAATQIIVLSTRGLDQYLVGIRTSIEVEKLKSLNGDLIRELSRKNERERVVETFDTKLLSYPVDDIIEFMRIIITDKDMPPLYHGVTKRKIQEERYIILYGGNDIDWIRRFTRQVNSIASDLQGCIEMVYVGNRHDKDRGHGVQNVILIKQLSHCLPKSSMTYFWTRFDSMFQSKRAYKDWRVPKDILLQEMLRFRSHENWALLARGSTILVNGSGQIALNALEDMEKWRTKLLQS